MKITQHFIFLAGLLLATCAISLVLFSGKEGFLTTYDDYYQQLDTAIIATNNNNSYSKLRSPQQQQNSAIVHDFSSDTIESNKDFLNAVTTALMTPPDKTTDMNSIYKLEVQIANIQTENARKLLSEMGNPNVSKKPRSFLQYMNWYGINCPIDSNICVNVV
jgi:hypothetical protein